MMMSNIPNELDLNIPGGTYMATPTFVVVDKAGQWFATSMGSYGVPAKQFGIHVWYRPKISAQWQLILFRNGCHGNLTVLQGQLFFIVNDKDNHVRATKIQQYQGQ
jgi:hypothetical protein